jgi:hypothetical protein
MEDIKIKKEYVGLRRICPGFGVMVIQGFMPKDIVDAFKLAGVEIGEEGEEVGKLESWEVGKLESGEVGKLESGEGGKLESGGELESWEVGKLESGEVEKAKGKRHKAKV